jgi:chromosomal replication initiation ATPase DnaA
MDAKQVWRAALGELQVSLSPANFETWLRDTQLVDVDEQRFRIAVPNGFAKDWLESRYRSLISQTLARIVGYSVQVEFVIASSAEAPGDVDGTVTAGSTTLSNHAFGLALDLNVPGNQRGSVGQMDRGVVAIFKSWGFTWGGDWGYTDPMHFEMNRLVRPQ